MRKPEFIFYQGSTPQFTLELPAEVDEGADTVYVTMSQDGQTVREYCLNDTARTPAENTVEPDGTDGHIIRFRMSQEDTSAFAAGDCALQVRMKKNGAADTFIPVSGYVGRAQKEGVI